MLLVPALSIMKLGIGNNTDQFSSKSCFVKCASILPSTISNLLLSSKRRAVLLQIDDKY